MQPGTCGHETDGRHESEVTESGPSMGMPQLSAASTERLSSIQDAVNATVHGMYEKGYSKKSCRGIIQHSICRTVNQLASNPNPGSSPAPRAQSESQSLPLQRGLPCCCSLSASMWACPAHIGQRPAAHAGATSSHLLGSARSLAGGRRCPMLGGPST
eukprot:365347-Chlamydomonas_euryale.AAC.11